jgi:hypothetical protein
MVDEDRKIKIAVALDDVVWPGETWIIRRKGAKFEVEEGNRSSLADDHPELYGRLLQVNERVSEAGGWMVIVGMLCTLAFCVAVHLDWLVPLAGDKLEPVRSFWFYGFALVLAFFAFAGLAKLWEGVVYRRYRDSMLQSIEKAGTTPQVVLVQIEGDESLDDLADRMKSDEGLIQF